MNQDDSNRPFETTARASKCESCCDNSSVAAWDVKAA